MASIRKTIDVPAGPALTADAWVRFIDSVLVGRRKLACDELACVDPLSSGLVGFERLDDAHTRVGVTIPAPDDAGGSLLDLLEQKAAQDLALFSEYIESGAYAREHESDVVRASAVREDARRGRLTPRESRPDVESFSVRRSGRT